MDRRFTKRECIIQLSVDQFIYPYPSEPLLFKLKTTVGVAYTLITSKHFPIQS